MEAAANKLFDALAGQLVKRDIERIKDILYNSPLPPGTLEECNTFSQICLHLVSQKKIRPEENDFEILKDLFRQMNKKTLVDMITKHEGAHGKGQGKPYARSGVKQPTTEPTPPVTDNVRPSTSNEAAGANNDHLVTSAPMTAGKIDNSHRKVTSSTAAQDTVLSPPASLGKMPKDKKKSGPYTRPNARSVRKRPTTSPTLPVTVNVRPSTSNEAAGVNNNHLATSTPLTAGKINNSQRKVTSSTTAQDTVLSPPASLGRGSEENRDHHNRLALLLFQNLTVEQFGNLKLQFHRKPFGNGDLEKITNFRELWYQLEMCRAIRVGDYNKLKTALEAINADELLGDIQECENKMALHKGKN